MIILPVHTRLLQKGDDLVSTIRESVDILPHDILVISSKAIATVEGAAIDLSRIEPSDEALMWSTKTGRSGAFCQAVIDETKRLNGRLIGTCPGAILTEIKPDGLKTGVILAPNAGLDESNIDLHHAIGWPIDPVKSAHQLREALGIAIIITDSCCKPRRIGVTAFALVVSGIDPLKSEVGSTDLFGRTLRVTNEATADQLSTAANFVMGNASQSIPAAIIREHNVPLTSFEGWVDGIEPEEDLFHDLFKT